MPISNFSLLPLPEQVRHIAILRATGMTYREIQAKVGCSCQTVGNRLQDNEARKILQDATRHHVQSLPLAIARHDDLIASNDEGICLKAIELRYKITGILPQHTVNVHIGQIIGQQTIVSNPTVLAALSHVLDAQLSGETMGPIDVVPIHSEDDGDVSG